MSEKVKVIFHLTPAQVEFFKTYDRKTGGTELAKRFPANGIVVSMALEAGVDAICAEKEIPNPGLFKSVEVQVG